ncbi:MAG: DNA-processing protein DprA [Treponemataceae bacterium]
MQHFYNNQPIKNTAKRNLHFDAKRDINLDFAIASLSFLKIQEKISLQKQLDKLSELRVLSIDDISVMVGRAIRTTLWKPEELERKVEKARKIITAYNIGFCRYDDDEIYPLSLHSMYDKPYMLFWRGTLDCLFLPRIAIVGTRLPSVAGSQEAFCLAKDLASTACIISGLAYGIDAAAHKGVLAGKGKTAAVLASGVDTLSPSGNRGLAASIIQSGGCVISEYLPGEQAYKWRFIQRNAVISALSQLVVVAEAPANSGALITADFALEQNRELVFLRSAYERDLLKTETEKKVKNCIQYYVNDGALLVDCADTLIKILTEMPSGTENDFLLENKFTS